MKVRIKKGAKNICPKKWFEINLKKGNIYVEWMIDYLKHLNILDYNEYELLYKDNRYALVRSITGSVLCVFKDDIIEGVEVGNIVKVVNDGLIFTTYGEFFIENNIDDKYLMINYQFENSEIDKDKEYIVRYIGKHSLSGKKVCVIQENVKKDWGKVYLIEEGGLRK